VTGASALIILAIGQLVFIACNLLAFTLLMCGKQVIEVANTLTVTALNVVMNWMLVPEHGITGAAISMLASQIVGIAPRSLEVRSILRIGLYTPKYFKPIVALVPVSLAAVALQGIASKTGPLALSGALVSLIAAAFLTICVCYFATLYFLGIEKEDLQLWRDLRMRQSSAC
jgi:O-antigen/teichoic acid export membrane protein